MDAFLVEINKKSISDKIREKRQENKVQDKMIVKDSSSITSDLTHYKENLFITSIELVTLSEQVVKESILTYKALPVKEPSAIILSVKLPPFFEAIASAKDNSTPIIQISE